MTSAPLPSSAPHGSAPQAPARGLPSQGLKGRVRVPGDKSVSQPLPLSSARSPSARTSISGLLEGEDVLNTAKACAQLGATVERLGEGEWRVEGVGVRRLPRARKACSISAIREPACAP